MSRTSKRRNITSDKRKQILKSLRVLHNDICQKCNVVTNDEDYESVGIRRALGPTYPTIEHIVPYSVSREYDIKNLTLYCNKCNQDSGKYHDPIQNVLRSLKAIESATNDTQQTTVKDTIPNGFQYHSAGFYIGYSYTGRKSRAKKR